MDLCNMDWIDYQRDRVFQRDAPLANSPWFNNCTRDMRLAEGMAHIRKKVFVPLLLVLRCCCIL